MNLKTIIPVCVSVVLASFVGLAHAGDFLSGDEIRSTYTPGMIFSKMLFKEK